MNYIYEERNNRLNLVCYMGNNVLNNYVYSMLMYNQLFGIIKPVYEDFGDGMRRLVYDVSNCMTVKDYLTSYGSNEIAQRIFEYMEYVWTGLNAYGISERSCIWDLDYMYYNYVTGEIFVVCVPTDTYVGNSVPKYLFLKRLSDCVQSDRVESLYPYIEEGEFEGETTVLCVTDDPFVLRQSEKPYFKTFKEEKMGFKQRMANRREQKLMKKEAKNQRRRAAGYMNCHIPGAA